MMNHKMTCPPLSEMEPPLSPFHTDFTAPHLRIVEALLRSSPHVVFVQDQHGRYVCVGLAAARACGLPAEAMLGKTSAELGLVSDAMREIDRLREQVFSNGLAVCREMVLPTVNGLHD